MADRDDLKHAMSLLIEIGPDLRRAGVESFRGYGLHVHFTPHVEEFLPDLTAPTPTEPDTVSDPFSDASTYGEGGEFVPGFSRLNRSE
jgi:hypothetical protein